MRVLTDAKARSESLVEQLGGQVEEAQVSDSLSFLFSTILCAVSAVWCLCNTEPSAVAHGAASPSPRADRCPGPRSWRWLLQAAAAGARRARQEAERRLPELRQQAERLLAEAKAAKAQPADAEHSVRAGACRSHVQSCLHQQRRGAAVLAGDSLQAAVQIVD